MGRDRNSINQKIYDALVARGTATCKELEADLSEAGVDVRAVSETLSGFAAGRIKWGKDVRRIDWGTYTVEPEPKPDPKPRPDKATLTVIAHVPSGSVVATDAEGNVWLARPLRYWESARMDGDE